MPSTGDCSAESRNASANESGSDRGSASSPTLPPSIAICGINNYARCLAWTLKAAGFTIAGVWGPSAKDTEAFAQDLQISKWTTKEDELLRDTNVYMAVVWTAPSVQSLLFDKAVGIGKSVICGLPVGVDQQAVKRMRTAAKDYPLLYIVAQGMRFLPAVAKARALVREGVIGEVRLCDVRLTCAPICGTYFDWPCDSMMGGGVLTMHGALIVDLLWHITGCKISKVVGMMKTFNRQTDHIRGIRQITSDDFCVFEFETERTLCGVVNLDASGSTQQTFQLEMAIAGSQGRLVLRNTDLFIQKSNGEEEQLINDPISALDIQRATGACDGNGKPDLDAPIMKGLVRMVEALKEATMQVNSDPIQAGASFDDWVYVQKVIDAVKKACESRQWCRVRTRVRS